MFASAHPADDVSDRAMKSPIINGAKKSVKHRELYGEMYKHGVARLWCESGSKFQTHAGSIRGRVKSKGEDARC